MRSLSTILPPRDIFTANTELSLRNKTLVEPVLSGNTTGSANITLTGNISASYFIGDGSALTGVATPIDANIISNSYDTANLAYVTAVAAINYADSTLTSFPGSTANADYSTGEEYPGEGTSTDAFGVPLAGTSVYSCTDPRGNIFTIDLGALS